MITLVQTSLGIGIMRQLTGCDDAFKFLGNSVVTRNRLCSAELLIYYDKYISKRFISTR